MRYEGGIMDTLDAIAARRSIRKFKDTPIPGGMIEAILAAASQAPSGKNRQPWRFVVVKEGRRAEMLARMREGLDAVKARGEDAGSAEWSAKVMGQAPVTVFVFNPEGLPPWMPHTVEQLFWDLVDTQSIGAAIQNMLLAAQSLGLGSLWICDVFSAYEELRSWMGEKGAMIAAVSFGYPDEAPAARPRKAMGDIARTM
jgi:nitroreductase